MDRKRGFHIREDVMLDDQTYGDLRELTDRLRMSKSAVFRLGIAELHRQFISSNRRRDSDGRR